MDKRHEKTFYQIKYIDGKQARDKMFNIISHERNAN